MSVLALSWGLSVLALRFGFLVAVDQPLCEAGSLALGPFDQGRTHRFVKIVHLAVETVDAFVRIDPAIGVDRLNRAAIGTNLALESALPAPLQPIEHAHTRRQRQGSSHRTEIAAKKSLDKKPGGKQRPDKEEIRPTALEPKDDRRLKGFDLRRNVKK